MNLCIPFALSIWNGAVACPLLTWVSSGSPRQHGDAEGGGSERLLAQGHLRIWQWVLSIQSSACHDTTLSSGCTGLSVVQPWRFAGKESETCHCIGDW